MTHKTYVTFGQDHIHNIGGKLINKDCVAVITTEGPDEGRDAAFEMFGRKFCMEYPEIFWKGNMKYFPRGYVNIEYNGA